MFFEARTHEIVPVADAMAAARFVKEKGENVWNYQCPEFKVGDKTIVIVNDASIHDSDFAEVAVLCRNDDGSYDQIESITVGWIKTVEEVEKTFLEAAETPYPMGKRTLIVGKPKGDETAWFTCGCCGTGFKGNVKHQQKFDQDAGYGYCPRCEKEIGW